VYLLIQDARVDPSANNNWGIRAAEKNGHTDVVNLLLQDPRYKKFDEQHEHITVSRL
jgi:hypothetical protein